MEKLYYSNTNQNKVRIVNINIKQIDFRAKNITRDKQGYFMMMKGSILHSNVKC